MDFLEPNQVEQFPMEGLQETLIRTGTPSDGSCLLHSIFLAYRSYRELSKEEREVYIKDKRGLMADQLTKEKWLAIQDGSISLLQIMERMRSVIFEVPEWLKDPEEMKLHFKDYQLHTEAIHVLFQLLEPSLVDDEILPEWDTECSHQTEDKFEPNSYLSRIKEIWYRLYYRYIVNQIEKLEKDHKAPPNLMTNEERLSVIHKLANISYVLFDMVVESAFEKFKEEVRNPETWVDIYSFLYMMDELGLSCNLLLLDASTKNFFNGMKMFPCFSQMIQEEKPCVVILYHPDTHFESIGRILDLGDNIKNISRIFTFEDELIGKARDFLLEI